MQLTMNEIILLENMDYGLAYCEITLGSSLQVYVNK